MIASRFPALVVCGIATVWCAARQPACAAEAPPATDSPPTFETHARPILKAYCFQCHGEQGKTESGLDLRLRRLAVAGGESGPAVVPGKPGESLMLERIRSGEMPPGKDAKKPTPEQIASLEQWISTGAATARIEPEKIDAGFLITEDDRRHWSFQSIGRPEVPTVKHAEMVRTPIDAFLLHELEQRGTAFSPDADRRTLVRRAFFDLVGLPPSIAELEEAIGDKSADWYERLVDRLLNSPHYGERWGRHWLDVAGYADSEGHSSEDPVRDHIFRYRDYVIRSFNADKPFDEFIREQLAGDEMVPPPHDELTPEQAEKLAATGLLVMAPNPLASRGGGDARQSHDAWIAESLKIVSSSLLGLTVGCAQCHDHRYDPISQEDYYRFRAIFEPAFDLARWNVPRKALISLYTDAHRERAVEIEAEAKKIDRRKQEAEQAAYLKVLDRELDKVPEDKRAAVREAHSLPPAKRTAAQRSLLRDFPRLDFTAQNLQVYDRAAAAEVKKIADEAAALRATIEKEGFVQAMSETPGISPPTFLLARGDYQQRRHQLPPDELTILKPSDRPVVAPDDPTLPTTGRRLAYARRLTDGSHPLAARVIVNRVWMHHFGRGLCATPSDFGLQGDRPSHPELLDWLAQEFMADGWSLKRLHRRIMTSTAYRQSLRTVDSAAVSDPENRLLRGLTVRRLEAEVIRDSILAVSGKLNTKQFGPPVSVMRDPDGEIVVGIESMNAGIPGPRVALNGEEFRRSVYVQVRRSKPLSMLQTFDAPTMEPNCTARTASTVAPQSLMLMNNGFVVEQSRFFAERISREVGSDASARIDRAWQLALGRLPSYAEKTEAAEFLAARAEYFRDLPSLPPAPSPDANRRRNAPAANADRPEIVRGEPEFEALALLCQTVLSCNEFLYVD
jgi:mono/diheme cytochrome c family protein